MEKRSIENIENILLTSVFVKFWGEVLYTYEYGEYKIKKINMISALEEYKKFMDKVYLFDKE